MTPNSCLLVHGDARRIPLPDGSVSCCVTSPPYFGLRDYGTGRWEGGDPGCDHQESSPTRTARSKASSGLDGSTDTIHMSHQFRDLCRKCGARRVDRQLGLEDSPSAYVAAMVRAFREVRRVLHPSGVVFLNIGDSYAGSGMTGGTESKDGGAARVARMFHGNRRDTLPGLKPKDLIGIPWLLAFALRDDGWWLRSEIIWAKPNPMPESATDRPTKSHEQVFLLSKRESYFWDAEAVREPSTERPSGNKKPVSASEVGCPISGGNGFHSIPYQPDGSGRNLRSVWSIPTESWPGAHYATFPRRLVEPCVKAGSSQRGVCPECGAPWERVVDREFVPTQDPRFPKGGTKGLDASNGWGATPRGRTKTDTLGWQPTCAHAHDPVPAVVLDPFCGSATTGVVATALGRRFVGLDLSRDYLTNQARRRLERPHAPAVRPGRPEPMPLFDGGEPC